MVNFKNALYPALAMASLIATPHLRAQTTPGQPGQSTEGTGQNQQAPSRVPLWECSLPTGKFAVDVRTITSVSMHEYLVDGGLKVVEVTVCPLGSAIARFYFAEPMTVSAPGGIGQSVLDQMQQKIREGAERVAGTSGNDALLYQVIKKYPEATHAHTIEFRLKSREQADKIYESAYNAWRQYRPAKLEVE